ncbi:hypothetical protein Bca4012_023128 [Brassica carinata]|uniref:Uncharacterized protein n=1 Tax=Brassica carinata TaxID=52824 RepID=A0A8X7W3L6_BRACI|nr:hypothetical protein Bca52824_016417 [Brassica carinata]
MLEGNKFRKREFLRRARRCRKLQEVAGYEQVCSITRVKLKRSLGCRRSMPRWRL